MRLLVASLLGAACGLQLSTPRAPASFRRSNLRMVSSWYDTGARLGTEEVDETFYEEPPIAAPDASTAMGKTRKVSISDLKAAGEAAVASRADLQAAYAEKAGASASAGTAPAAGSKTLVAELRAEGEAIVASREDIQAMYRERAPSKAVAEEEAEEEGPVSDEDVAAFLARAEQRSAARAAARAEPEVAVPEPAPPPAAAPVPAMPPPPAPAPATPKPPAGALTTETARSVNELLGVDTRDLDLPSPVVEKLEEAGLLVPNKLNDGEQDGWLGAIAAGTALLFASGVFEVGAGADVILSALVGGGLSGYAALRKDSVGDVARSGGKVANKGALTLASKVKQANEEYKITEQAKDKAIEIIKKVTAALKDSLK